MLETPADNDGVAPEAVLWEAAQSQAHPIAAVPPYNVPTLQPEPQASDALKARIDYGWNVVKQHVELIKFCDTKAGLILAVLLPYTLLSANAISGGLSSLHIVLRVVTCSLLSLSLAAFVIAGFFLIRTVQPRGGPHLVERAAADLVAARDKRGVGLQ